MIILGISTCASTKPARSLLEELGVEGEICPRCWHKARRAVQSHAWGPFKGKLRAGSSRLPRLRRHGHRSGLKWSRVAAVTSIAVTTDVSRSTLDSHEARDQSRSNELHVMHRPVWWLQQRPCLPSPPQTACASVALGMYTVVIRLGALTSIKLGLLYINGGSNHMATGPPTWMRSGGITLWLHQAKNASRLKCDVCCARCAEQRRLMRSR